MSTLPSVILAFNFAALQHNLNCGKVLERGLFRAARNCISHGVEEIAVSGIPGILLGVPFFANESCAATELQRSRVPLTMIPWDR